MITSAEWDALVGAEEEEEEPAAASRNGSSSSTNRFTTPSSKIDNFPNATTCYTQQPARPTNPPVPAQQSKHSRSLAIHGGGRASARMKTRPKCKHIKKSKPPQSSLPLPNSHPPLRTLHSIDPDPIFHIQRKKSIFEKKELHG